MAAIDFINTNLKNLPNVNDLDAIFKINEDFSKRISNSSDSEKEELRIYLTKIYNENITKIEGCDKIVGGKKSRRQKHKKRNTLKRGGSWTIPALGAVILVVGLLGCLSGPTTRREENWNLNGPGN